jgi:hypothetical protein
MSATTPLPTSEQEARAEWDLLLIDIEYRIEQLRQIKVFEPRRLMLAGLTAGAAVFGTNLVGTLGVLWRLLAH